MPSVSSSPSALHPDVAFLHSLADVARDVVMPLFRSEMKVDNKEVSGFDPVTDADRQAELQMRKRIHERFPDHGILGEEFESEQLDASGRWILDPVDGTRAFIAGLPTWGTLIGYFHEDGTKLGMMSQPFTGERFVGDGSSSFFSGPGGDRVLKVRACADLSEATLFTTTPAMFNAAELPAYLNVERSVRLARYGVDCYAYCMVAMGMVDLVVESALKPVDIAPLVPVIEGAGGIVTNWRGGSPLDGGQVIAAGSAEVHQQALAYLSKAAV
ncbi:histidinol-phosphatase [uncultured Cohaesibacter sp.]|uniref:histidinol-phosphatase n=1 Tax=uncultured Cohaesibacter sp. TaxID=1002546 RepID=UPI0029C944AB|nr:histidinol-phosphatase [uncultured Cohaesibacter sp.]